MQVTYAVAWEADGVSGSGRLELGPDALLLAGRDDEGAVARSVAYRDIDDVRIGRRAGERLRRRPTLILELATGEVLRLASVAQPGVVAELAARVAVLRSAA